MTPLRVAIVGAGPAGAFTAAQIGAAGDRFAVDVFERLPTPWGLLRAGVAPDHGAIKKLDETFERDVFGRGARFFGNVRVGEDVSHAQLMERYAAVVYAVGAQTDKSLGLPGEDLPGSLPATAFVGWYNAHPDFRELDPPLSDVETVVVIGNGNVAADVTRLLTRDRDELGRTDVADHAREALRASPVSRVVVVGRRGPAQAAFTSAELRELGRLKDVDVVVDPAELELDPVSAAWLAEEGTFTARSNLELLREYAARPRSEGARAVIELRFLRSPRAILGDGRVESVELVRNALSRDESGTIRANATDDAETIACGLVLRSVGYRGVALPDVPFDEQRYVLPHERGRVLDASSGELLPGVYAVGWIKRGPTGILGTNKRDAAETVRSLVEDADHGRLTQPDGGDIASVLDGADVVTADRWRAIDAAERAAGAPAERPRVKRATREELLAPTG